MLLTAINSNAAAPAGTGSAPLPQARPATAVPAAVVPTRSEAPAPPATRPHQNDRRELDKAVETLNDFTGLVAQDVRFSVDEDSGRTLVTVVDTLTQEVLRQIPSKEALSLARSLDKMQGLLIHEKA